MYDLVIRNGQVIDGLGNPRRRADVGIVGDRIATIGDLADQVAAQTMDAAGLIVAPGFVDVHSHSDFTLLVNRKAESSVRQGVTTEVIGNCGASWATVDAPARLHSLIPAYVRAGVEVDWATFAQYLERLERPGIAINVVPLVGHGAVRLATMGFEARPPGPEELGRMKALVAEALDTGAAGLSFGLQYAPGSNAGRDEIVALCQVAAGRDRIVTVHQRDYTQGYAAAIQEMVDAARESGARLQVSHVHPHKGGPPPAENWARGIAVMERAQQAGVDLAFDHHPYLWAMTLLNVVLPAWAFDGGAGKTAERLRDPATRTRIKLSPKEGPFVPLFEKGGYDQMVLAHAPQSHHLVGRTIAEIAEIVGKAPYDAVLDILLAEGEAMHDAFWIAQLYDEDVLRQLLAHPLGMVEADGMALAAEGPLAGLGFHPRIFGWTARMIEHHVRARQIMTLEAAVQKMTSFPADRVGLADRGRLVEGARADVVVFDLPAVRDNATYAKPAAYPSGIRHVLVNGRVVVSQGVHTGALPGAVLRQA